MMTYVGKQRNECAEEIQWTVRQGSDPRLFGDQLECGLYHKIYRELL